MATSGLTTSSTTVRDAIKHALMHLGVYSAMREPSAADEVFGIKTLNLMLKGWQTDGVNLWRLREYDITWPAASAEVLISASGGQPNINDIIELRYVGTTERPLERWEWGDYVSLPNKTQAGVPCVFSVLPELGDLRVRVWPVPADESTLRGTVNRVIEDVTNANETLDVPQAYLETVILCLAARLASAFGKAAEAGPVVEESRRLYRIMRAADRPASYIFEGVR